MKGSNEKVDARLSVVLHYSPLRPILGGKESMATSKLPLSGQGLHPDMKFGPA